MLSSRSHVVLLGRLALPPPNFAWNTFFHEGSLPGPNPGQILISFILSHTTHTHTHTHTHSCTHPCTNHTIHSYAQAEPLVSDPSVSFSVSVSYKRTCPFLSLSLSLLLSCEKFEDPSLSLSLSFSFSCARTPFLSVSFSLSL